MRSREFLCLKLLLTVWRAGKVRGGVVERRIYRKPYGRRNPGCCDAMPQITEATHSQKMNHIAIAQPLTLDLKVEGQRVGSFLRWWGKIGNTFWHYPTFKAIKTTTREFANCTTVHGILYVFDTALKILDRLLWFLICCFGLFLAVYWSYDAWITWKEHPVLTSVSSTGLPLQKIDFPAITICSQGLIQVTRRAV